MERGMGRTDEGFLGNYNRQLKQTAKNTAQMISCAISCAVCLQATDRSQEKTQGASIAEQ
jgi:hypothetical protein